MALLALLDEIDPSIKDLQLDDTPTGELFRELVNVYTETRNLAACLEGNERKLMITTANVLSSAASKLQQQANSLVEKLKDNHRKDQFLSHVVHLKQTAVNLKIQTAMKVASTKVDVAGEERITTAIKDIVKTLQKIIDSDSIYGDVALTSESQWTSVAW